MTCRNADPTTKSMAIYDPLTAPGQEKNFCTTSLCSPILSCVIRNKGTSTSLTPLYVAAYGLWQVVNVTGYLALFIPYTLYYGLRPTLQVCGCKPALILERRKSPVTGSGVHVLLDKNDAAAQTQQKS